MKRVIYSENVKKTREVTTNSVLPQTPYKSTIYWELEEQGEAYFHQWGSDYAEGPEGSCGNYTTAIIELDDGQIKNIPAEHIRFIK